MSWDDQLASLVRRARAERIAAENKRAAASAERVGPNLPPSGDPLRDYPELADLHGGASNEGDEQHNPWKTI